ncbi:GYDIA family GHMP kinase [Hyunsoonleella pacifica]|uniref:GHMP kinase n=1 Tax=Hyunsoonleella pacifica TaxID=1080224 RepID=A0A4Q9FLH3_9FLAO|nr:GYDIA family GHMP kinase [Hyunsoonleella pacifica]TBN14715.1 GHMP kinase [Hyunsoonleella pacifica]GGD16082.1 hypothetical protein GCM10011368_17580 [Hyunsoonleella pacifica]
MKTFKSNGKLLLTGEYVVLDGAISLAIPTKYGQSLNVKPIDSKHIHWKSFDEKNKVWFEDKFHLIDLKSNKTETNTPNLRLLQILNAAQQLSPNFLDTNTGFSIETYLDFPKNWGLGTSSTLINNIAEWANINPYELLKLTFGGSGYDIACAQHNTAITYQLLNDDTLKQHQDTNRMVLPVNFNPPFKDHLYFVYLNKKQNSRDGITHYKALDQNLKLTISEINTITEALISCDSIMEFQKLIINHEEIISKTINQSTIASKYFNDFDGAIKSLGAWGGDFILACCETNPTRYFTDRGYNTVVPYKEMILK